MDNDKTSFIATQVVDKEGTTLTYFSKFIKDVMKNENGKHKYQGVQLKHCKWSLQCQRLSFGNCLEYLQKCWNTFWRHLWFPIFTNIESLLNTFRWLIIGECGKRYFDDKGPPVNKNMVPQNKAVFQSTELKDECQNVLLVFENLLVTVYKCKSWKTVLNLIKTIESNW